MALISVIPNDGGGGTTVGDHFAPRIIVGNTLSPQSDPAVAQLAPFMYIPDPGDGSGIATALAAAVSGYDIYIRPGTYTRAASLALFSIPAGVRVRGAPPGANGLSGTIIVASAGDATHAQDVFTLGTGAALEDIQIRVPAGVQGGQQGNAIIQVPSLAVRLRNVYIDMTFGGAGQRNTVVGVWSGSGVVAPGTGDVFEDCEVVLPSVASTFFQYVGFIIGDSGVDSVVATGRGPVFRGCVVRGGQGGIFLLNVAAPTVEGLTVDGMILSPSSSNGIFYFIDATATTPVEGPRILDPRIFITTTGDAANASAAGIAIENAMTDAQISYELRDYVITGQQIVFATAGGLVGARQGIKIRTEDGSTGQVNQGAIGPGVISGTEIVVLVQSRTNDNTAGAKGSINDLTITGVTGRGFATFGAFTGEGVQLNIANVPAQPKINRVSVTGCNLSGAPAGTNGVLIASAGVTNTCVCGNQLTPNGGTAITDAGTGSQITGNVP